MKKLVFIFLVLSFQSCIETDYMGKTNVTNLGWFGFSFLALFILFMIWANVKNAKDKKNGVIQEPVVDSELLKNLKIKKSGINASIKYGYVFSENTRDIVINTLDNNLIIFDNKSIDSHILINKKDILDIRIEEKGDRSVGKAATGAIIGGVLTGGIGLIAGAALGAKKKDLSELFIDYMYNDKNFTLCLKTGKNTLIAYNKIVALYK